MKLKVICFQTKHKMLWLKKKKKVLLPCLEGLSRAKVHKHSSFAWECIVCILNKTLSVGSVGHLESVLSTFTPSKILASPYCLGLPVSAPVQCLPWIWGFIFPLNSLHSAATADVFWAKERSWTNSLMSPCTVMILDRTTIYQQMNS